MPSARTVTGFLLTSHSTSRTAGSPAPSLRANDAKQATIERAELDGETLRFEVRDNVGRIVNFRLSLAGTSLSGESTVGSQTSKVLLSRSAIAIDGGGVGIGSGGGGTRSATGEGAGSGKGSGAGPGQSVRYRGGGGVSAPALKETRAANYQGTVLLYVKIDPNGDATNIKVQQASVWASMKKLSRR